MALASLQNSPPYQVTPLTPQVGARVEGMRLSADLSDDDIATIEGWIDTHHVLVFPGQSLTAPALRDFTARFGPLFDHHDDVGVLRHPEAPEVLEMRKEPDGTRLFGGSDWHADVTFRAPGAYLSILHAQVLPPVGGDTGFASTVAAFEALSPGMQALFRNLNAVHSYDGPGRPDRDGQTAVHPVVRTNPRTHREGLFINRMFANRFEGMSQDESKDLIAFLDRHMTRPEFTCRVGWELGQVVMWDNRFSLHYPINDFSGHQRLLIRCTAMDT